MVGAESHSLLEQECPICYYAISNEEILEPCGHQIHSSCFLMSKSELCPICRQIVEKPLYIPLQGIEYYYVPPVSKNITLALVMVVVMYLFIFILYNHLHPHKD
jgi:hypothetical protein